MSEKYVTLVSAPVPKNGIVSLIADRVPPSLELTGADVNGLPDDYIIAAGSMLDTPEGDVYGI